jgi:8-oxo-dGTP pyrophosphatase MutT (NUDIX family)
MGVGVILKSGEKFLLQLRDDKEWIKTPNKWSIFGGGIEKGESPKTTAIREMEEELGLKLTDKDLKLIVKVHSHYIFLSEKEINLSQLELHEGQDMKLFSRREIIWMKNVHLWTRLFFIFNKPGRSTNFCYSF